MIAHAQFSNNQAVRRSQAYRVLLSVSACAAGGGRWSGAAGLSQAAGLVRGARCWAWAAGGAGGAHSRLRRVAARAGLGRRGVCAACLAGVVRGAAAGRALRGGRVQMVSQRTRQGVGVGRGACGAVQRRGGGGCWAWGRCGLWGRGCSCWRAWHWRGGGRRAWALERAIVVTSPHATGRRCAGWRNICEWRHSDDYPSPLLQQPSRASQ